MWNRKNEYRKVKVKMSTIPDKPAILYLNKHQFICKDCQNPLQLKLLKLRRTLIPLKIQKLAPLIKLFKENSSKKQLNLVMHSLILHREYSVN